MVVAEEYMRFQLCVNLACQVLRSAHSAQAPHTDGVVVPGLAGPPTSGM